MMEQEAASQTMYIAAMGTEYTFKATAASAKVVFALIKAISEKVKLSTADKKLLKIASDGVAAGVTLKTEDLKTFKSMANAFGLTFCVVGSKHSVEAGLTDIMVRQDQIARVNDCLSRLGYGKVKEAESTKKESPSLSDLSKQTPELKDEAGISELWGEFKNGYRPLLPEEVRENLMWMGNTEIQAVCAEYEAATLRYKTAFEALPKGDNKGSPDSVKSKAAYAEFNMAFVEFQSAADRYKSMHEKMKNVNGKTGKVSRVESAIENAAAKAELFNASQSFEKVSEVAKSVPLTDILAK